METFSTEMAITFVESFSWPEDGFIEFHIKFSFGNGENLKSDFLVDGCVSLFVVTYILQVNLHAILYSMWDEF